MGRSNKTKTQETTIRYRLPSFAPPELRDEDALYPNQWFANKFPDAAKHYGPAFMEGRYQDADGITRIVPEYLNTDFFAAALGGDRRLGNQIVFYRPENTFYFFDPAIDAFSPVSEAKLRLLLSNYLIRCAQDMSCLVDIGNLVVKFREDSVLTSVINRAKAVLCADEQFFSRATGHKRIVRGQLVDPNAEPVYKVFVKQALKPESEAMLTVSDCFMQYDQFCRAKGLNALDRSEFKKVVAEVIREEFGFGLRHDIRAANGRQNDGWRGLNFRFGSSGETLHSRS